jgi:WD40 repeat protein
MEIKHTRNIRLVVLCPDEQHIVVCDDKGKIRRWKVDTGVETGIPMDGGANVSCISVSKDGKWIANGASWGRVKVWNASNHKMVVQFKGHSISKRVCAIDISPHERIATGSTDKTVFVWALETGERLLGPLQHDNELAAVKFSPDGRLLATATWQRASVRIYDSDDGSLLSDLPIPVASSFNQSIAWSTDSKNLLALSSDGNIHCLDASTGTSLSKWPVQRGNNKPKWIGLASSGKFVAAATDFSVSFWDPATHQQIGPAIGDHVNPASSFAILEDRKIALAVCKKITFHDIPTPRNDDSVSIS